MRLHLAGNTAVIELDLTARQPVEIRLMLPEAEHQARLEPGEHRYGLMPVARMDRAIGVEVLRRRRADSRRLAGEASGKLTVRTNFIAPEWYFV